MVSLKGATRSGALLARVVLSFSLLSQRKKLVLVLETPGRRPWINPSRGRHRSDQSWAFAKRRGHDEAREGCRGVSSGLGPDGQPRAAAPPRGQMWGDIQIWPTAPTGLVGPLAAFGFWPVPRGEGQRAPAGVVAPQTPGPVPDAVLAVIDLCISNRHTGPTRVLFGYETTWKPRGA